MRKRIYWNRDWKFTTKYCEELSEKDYNGELECVCLPHTVAETPFHYFDEVAVGRHAVGTSGTGIGRSDRGEGLGDVVYEIDFAERVVEGKSHGGAGR